jgi:hypothetical protein
LAVARGLIFRLALAAVPAFGAASLRPGPEAILVEEEAGFAWAMVFPC